MLTRKLTHAQEAMRAMRDTLENIARCPRECPTCTQAAKNALEIHKED